MDTTFFHEILLIDITYGNNDLFVQWPLGGHVDVQLRFGVVVSLDDLLDVLDVLNVGHLERGESCFDFQHFLSVADVLGQLSI